MIIVLCICHVLYLFTCHLFTISKKFTISRKFIFTIVHLQFPRIFVEQRYWTQILYTL